MIRTSGLFFALYTAWGLSWLLVAMGYGKATYASWRMMGGTWRGSVGFFARGFCRYFENMGDDVFRWVGRSRPERASSNAKYSSGHVLRFAVTIAALLPIITSLTTATADRSMWSLAVRLSILLAVALSEVSALMHLDIAWKSSPQLWRWYVFGVVVWLSTAPVGYRILIGY